MVRVLWCCHQKLGKDLTAGVFYIEEIRVFIFTMFKHKKVLLNWLTVCVFVINGFVYCSIISFVRFRSWV